MADKIVLNNPIPAVNPVKVENNGGIVLNNNSNIIQNTNVNAFANGEPTITPAYPITKSSPNPPTTTEKPKAEFGNSPNPPTTTEKTKAEFGNSPNPPTTTEKPKAEFGNSPNPPTTTEKPKAEFGNSPNPPTTTEKPKAEFGNSPNPPTTTEKPKAEFGNSPNPPTTTEKPKAEFGNSPNPPTTTEKPKAEFGNSPNPPTTTEKPKAEIPDPVPTPTNFLATGSNRNAMAGELANRNANKNDFSHIKLGDNSRFYGDAGTYYAKDKGADSNVLSSVNIGVEKGIAQSKDGKLSASVFGGIGTLIGKGAGETTANIGLKGGTDKVSASIHASHTQDLHKKAGTAESQQTWGIRTTAQITENLQAWAGAGIVRGKMHGDGYAKKFHAKYAELGADYALGDGWNVGASIRKQFDSVNTKDNLVAGLNIGYGNNRKPTLITTNLDGGDPPQITTAFNPVLETVVTKKEQKGFTIQADTLFSHNKADLRVPLEGSQLAEFSKFLNDQKALKSGGSLYQALREDGKSLTITGHTDYTGSDAYNQDLSEKRAKNVEKYLVSQAQKAGNYGVGTLLHSVGKGESEVSPHLSEDVVKAKNFTKAERNAYIQADRKVVVTGEKFSADMYGKLDVDYLTQKYPTLAKQFVVGVNTLTQTFEQKGDEKVLKDSTTAFVPNLPKQTEPENPSLKVDKQNKLSI